MSLNSAQIIGYLGHDPSLRTLPSGDTVANVSVATSETWKDKGGAKQERTTWFAVSFWGRLADIAGEYLHKGSLVYVQGTISVRAYTTRAGEPGASLELRARELKMLGGKPREEGDAHAAPSAAAHPAPAQDFDDDIPF